MSSIVGSSILNLVELRGAAYEAPHRFAVYFDPSLSFNCARTSSMLKLAAFCRCG